MTLRAISDHEPAEPPAASRHYVPARGNEAAELFADGLAAGNTPSVREIRAELHIGQAKAMAIRDYLADPARTSRIAR